MNNKCPFQNKNACIIWQDYEICQYELEEAAELSHANWIEIQHLQDRVELLELLLKQAGIGIPPEY